jgi:hypothetical protein
MLIAVGNGVMIPAILEVNYKLDATESKMFRWRNL